MPLWTHITAGDAHSVLLDSDGFAWALGRNLDGQLGDGTQVDRVTLTSVGVPPPGFCLT